jgi:hypothetical protein
MELLNSHDLIGEFENDQYLKLIIKIRLADLYIRW